MAATQTTMISASITAYSTAVGPLSSATNCRTTASHLDMTTYPFLCCWSRRPPVGLGPGLCLFVLYGKGREVTRPIWPAPRGVGVNFLIPSGTRPSPGLQIEDWRLEEGSVAVFQSAICALPICIPR